MSKPGCFSYIMSNRDWLEEHNIKIEKDCKECEHQKECIAAYNSRVYEHWMDDWYDGREDDEGWEEELG